MTRAKRKRFKTVGGLTLRLGGIVAFALCVGEPIGWAGLAGVALAIWIS